MEQAAEPILHEVGLRDGLQMEERVVPTETKLRWACELARAGVDILQLGSFVHPGRVPQMADSDELFRLVGEELPHPRPVLAGLVLNRRGLERGLACGVELFCMGVSASETHSRRNVGRSIAEAQEEILALASEARAAGRRVQLSIQSAFGCGFEGPVPPERVLAIADRYLEAGFTEISLADTAGHADPWAVRDLIGKLRERSSEIRLTVHLHNTYGYGLANCVAALEAGADVFETAVGGLGGCPFTKRPGGNVATEDWIHLLQRRGGAKNYDLQRLIGVARDMAAVLGHPLPGIIHQTGPIGGGVGG
ncbi:MAG: hydroxymethylglutaryl-CoA lyase [Acidobacteriota bacterium]